MWGGYVEINGSLLFAVGRATGVCRLYPHTQTHTRTPRLFRGGKTLGSHRTCQIPGLADEAKQCSPFWFLHASNPDETFSRVPMCLSQINVTVVAFVFSETFSCQHDQVLPSFPLIQQRR